jgi:DNA end-binding protein Ku
MPHASHARKKAAPSHTRRSKAGSHASGEAARSGSRGKAAVRGIWKGSISFGLLQIPVALVPAESRTEELHFRMLDRRDNSPIRYERVSSSTGKPVDWKDIVKGYEIEKDSFVVIEPEDLEKANVKATHTVDILDFVPRAQIEPAYFETPYYVLPEERATKAYVLLREALQKKDAVAIAQFVLRTRAHLVAVMPVGDALMLEVLRFGHELKDADAVGLPTLDAKSLHTREVAMAEQLIDGMMTEWKPTKYRDDYYRDVMTIIEEKAKTGETTEHHATTKGTIAHDDTVDLLALLKKSIAKSGRAANDSRPGPKKAHARKSGKKTRAA